MSISGLPRFSSVIEITRQVPQKAAEMAKVLGLTGAQRNEIENGPFRIERPDQNHLTVTTNSVTDKSRLKEYEHGSGDLSNSSTSTVTNNPLYWVG